MTINYYDDIIRSLLELIIWHIWHTYICHISYQTCLLRDRVLAMARDLLQFRASCAKSNSRHWAQISKLGDQSVDKSNQKLSERDTSSTKFLSTMKSHRVLKCKIKIICIIVVRSWRIHADLTIILDFSFGTFFLGSYLFNWNMLNWPGLCSYPIWCFWIF